MLKKLSIFLSGFFIFVYLTQNLTALNNQAQLNTVATISNLSQTAIWLNEDELAVGRWDGTITIFHCEDSLSLLQVLVPSKKGGITMLEKMEDSNFVSSNGSSSIALWERCQEGYLLKNSADYPVDFGSVDSAKYLIIENHQILLTGHSEGYLLIWEMLGDRLFLISSLNLQSDHPLESPYPLRNIRGIFPWKEGIVVTAAEDGDLCMIDVGKATIIYRQKYNEEAKRGINHLFISGDYLLVSNCSVGSFDRNLWLYRIENNRFFYLDSQNLVAEKNVEQVYAFDVGCISDGEDVYFVCTTEEGLLWYGQIKNELLSILNFKKISPKGGAALAIHPIKRCVASACYEVYLLELLLLHK